MLYALLGIIIIIIISIIYQLTLMYLAREQLYFTHKELIMKQTPMYIKSICHFIYTSNIVLWQVFNC